MPPERSGIADYSYELLEELRHHADVVAVVDDRRLRDARVPDGVALSGIGSADDLRADCQLYQMGNNPRYHRYFFGRTFDNPGILVMHDPSLADFTAEMCGGAESEIFRDEVTFDRPDIGPDDKLPLVDVGDGRKDLDRLEVLLARRIVEASVRTLVHSVAIAEEMSRRYPGSDIRAIQLPAPVLAAARTSSPSAGEVVFGVFGGINYYKRVRPILDAFVEVRARHPGVRMVVAGRADDHDLERELRAVASRPDLGGSIEIRTDLSLPALEQEMLRCDVGISLRWPTAGEMSATLMRTLGAGRPAIVSDVLQFRALDSRYCWRVTTDFDREHDDLVEVMSRAASDPAMCRRAGDAARSFVEREATYAAVAAQYLDHLEHAARRAPSSRAGRPRVGLVGVNVIRPSVPGEVADGAARVAAALGASGMDVVVVELPPAQRPRASGRAALARENRPGRADRTRRQDQADLHREATADALEWLDPADRGILARGMHLVDVYFVDPREVERIEALARARGLRGHAVVVVVSPEMVPPALGHKALCSLAEQVWAPSTHAAEVARLATRVPVSVVPWPVVPAGSPPEESACCTFVAVVAEGEPVARANPIAALEAFRQAFAPRERGVVASLVVAFAGSKGRDEARALLEAQAADVGAALVVDPTPAELRALVSGADVYVSLHRSQASGLGLADALAGGRPAVATGYSGNLDYMDDDSSALVGYTVRPMVLGELYLDPGRDSPTRKVQFWADADVDGAARSMRRLALDPELRRLMGGRAREVALGRLCPEVTAEAARRLLDGIDPARPRPGPEILLRRGAARRPRRPNRVR